MYYAVVDWTATPENPGCGFVNTKSVVAFRDREAQTAFVRERGAFDFSARAVSRLVAAGVVKPNRDGDKVAPIWEVGNSVMDFTENPRTFLYRSRSRLR